MGEEGKGKEEPTLEAARSAAFKESEELDESRFLKVSGYDFNSGLDLPELFNSFRATGFQASNLGDAIAIVNRMLSHEGPGEENARCKIFLGFTSNLISSGIRESIRFLVEHKMVDVLVTTAGGIEEDLIKCLGPTYKGNFTLSGSILRSKALNRIGNLLVPNNNYCKFEDWIMPIFDQMLLEQKTLNKVWTPSKMIKQLGKEINDPSSYLYWAFKNEIPVFCPGLTDGSLGDMLGFHSIRNPGLIIDIVGDVIEIYSEAKKASPRKTGMILLGGGIPKHHICRANSMCSGADFSVYINTGQEFDGSDSGARPDEAISWGSIKASANHVKVYCDATIAFPLLVAATFASRVEKSDYGCILQRVLRSTGRKESAGIEFNAPASLMSNRSEDIERLNLVEVKGYDFNRGLDFSDLFKSFSSTGFQASNLGDAIDAVNQMISWRLSDEEVVEGCSEEELDPAFRERVRCKIFLAVTSNLVSSGVRDTIRFLVEHKMVDVVVTTAGGISEDLVKCQGPTYRGNFSLRGDYLHSKGLRRIGNLLVSNSNYLRFEHWIHPVLDQMLEEQIAKGILWSPSLIAARLGKEIDSPSSYLYWASKNNIPVFSPALTDGTLGDILHSHSQHKDQRLVIDISQDIKAIYLEAVRAAPRKTGMIILGGGLSKHHVCNANMMRNGADFAVYINTAEEFDGSDAGAHPDEAVSWGKIRGTAKPVKVHCDATIAFPLLVAATFAKIPAKGH